MTYLLWLLIEQFATMGSALLLRASFVNCEVRGSSRGESTNHDKETRSVQWALRELLHLSTFATYDLVNETYDYSRQKHHAPVG